MSKKHFIASGCSFTFEPWNWPTPLTNHFGMNLINVGMSGQGNGLISKKVIYQVQKQLKEGKSPDDIFVGIMWSGVDRFSIYVPDTYQRKNLNGWVKNPTTVTGKEEDSHWLLLSGGWEDLHSKQWYVGFQQHIGSTIRTLEYILYTQWFLEKNNIKYFMTTYLDIFHKENDDVTSNKDVSYLYEMVDFSKFLPVKGQYEWVNKHYPEFGLPDNGDHHPTEYGHKKFTEEVIIPYVESNFDINDIKRKLL